MSAAESAEEWTVEPARKTARLLEYARTTGQHDAAVLVMEKFDYSAPADLFPARSRIGHRPVGYRRFDTAALAIRYAMEELPAEFLDGTVLEVEAERINGAGIRLLYASDQYPLARKP